MKYIPALLLVLCFYQVKAQSGSCPLLGPNQIINGNFEGGYYGFLSDFGRGQNNATLGGCATQGWILVSQVNPHYNYSCQVFPPNWSAQYGGANVPTSADPNHPSNTWVITTAICTGAEQIPDHSTGKGYFLTVDPDAVENRAYWKQTIDICPNTPYEFSAWVRNISGIPAPFFHFEVNGQSINQPTAYPEPNWVKTGATWFSGALSGPVQIALMNDQPGCIENDVAIDDIFFGICGGVVATSDTLQRFCTNAPPPYLVLSGEVVGLTDVTFQWQKYQPASMAWEDLSGETSDSLVFLNPNSGNAGRYRLLAAQNGNIQSENCRVSSTDFLIEARPFYTVAESKSICAGDVYLGYQTTGVFIDTLLSQFGCDSVRTLNLVVHPVFNLSLNATICQGENYGGHTLPGRYTDSLYSVNGCDSVRTVDLVVFSSYLEENYQLLCPGDNIVFNGETISGTGIYESNLTTINGCDSTFVLEVEVIPENFLGNDTILCVATTFTIQSPSPNTRWFDGSVGQTKTVQASGVYWANWSDNNGCLLTDSIQVLFNARAYVPNIFSPNDDGNNDLFVPQFSNSMFFNYQMQVFDRWGDLLYDTFSLENGWDGRYQNKPCETGVYVYIIRFALEGCGNTVLTGDVSLVR
ncbi:MAG: gliding motility-associated C-terminal domain-containing protein [Saprospiraceae bacterium]|nr:gliding motility-associated C-terminal domain-containing protein [Saprospiraceae bacterium]